jgi:hypothetical protein
LTNWKNAFELGLAGVDQRFGQGLAGVEQRLERIERQLEAIFKPMLPPRS